jgi:acetyl-CoA carboxylase biotin carboxylase subunit
VYYDSLIAKLIVWGATRPEALDRATRALREFKIIGVSTTIPFHLQLLQDKKFRAGQIHTKFLDTEFRLEEEPAHPAMEAALLAAALQFQRKESTTPKYATPRPLSQWKMSLRDPQ